jgi:hypothetical protein
MYTFQERVMITRDLVRIQLMEHEGQFLDFARASVASKHKAVF